MKRAGSAADALGVFNPPVNPVRNMLQARRISASAAHGARSVVRIFYVGCSDGRNFYRQASLRRQSYAHHSYNDPVE